MKKNILLSMVLVLGFGIGLFAQAGMLDSTFGVNGIVTTEFFANHESATSMALQVDGKLVVGGFSGRDFAIARYHPDGTLDNSFGDGGIQTTTFVAYPLAQLNAIVIQSDEKIVAAGYAGAGGGAIETYLNDFALARYLLDGTLDTTFGSDGILTTDFGTSGTSVDEASSLALQTDGKIVVAGMAGYDLAVVRYNMDGTLDNSFGSGGKVTISQSSSIAFERANSVIIQPNGKILVAGTFLARLNEDGTLDNSFDSDGILTTFFPSIDAILQVDGKIVSVGKQSNGANSDFRLVRYNPDGTLDDSFGTAGVTSTNINGNDIAGSLAIQADNKIVVTGTSGINPDYNFSIARYNQDGILDNSFGSSGILMTDHRMSDAAGDIVMQTDGKIVIAGGSDKDFALVRYHPDGSLDNGFSTDGIVTTNIGTSQEYANAVAIQPNGKIVVAGASNGYFYSDFALARYNEDGSLDSSFHSDGIVLTDEQAWENVANAVAIQPDDKIVMVGTTIELWVDPASHGTITRYAPDGTLDAMQGSPFGGIFGFCCKGANSVVLLNDGKMAVAGSRDGSFAIARHFADGSIDTSFGTDGVAVTDFGGFNVEANSVAIQPDGKILAAGHSGGGAFALARYNEDGTLDVGFGSGGTLTTAFGTSTENVASSVAIQSDGKIVAAGYAGTWPNYDFVLARYHSNGTLDGTFGTGGLVTTDLGGAEQINGLAIQTDGKILVVGSAWWNAIPDFIIVRYNPDGTLDGSFGSGGIVTTDIGVFDRANAITLQPDGKILVAGSSDGDFAIARYLSGLETGVFEKPDRATSQVHLFPNPANDFLNIQLPETTFTSFDVQVFDAHGRLVGQQPFTLGQTIQVGHLQSGFFTLKLADGERVYVGKFIKQ